MIYIYRRSAAFFSSYVGFTLPSERHRLVFLFIVLLFFFFFFSFSSPCLKCFAILLSLVKKWHSTENENQSF